MIDLAEEPLPGEGAIFTIETLASREEWAARRMTGIGGSDASALWREEIFDVEDGEPFQSPFSLYCQKRGLLPAVDETEAMEIGSAMEPGIVRLYEKRTGDRVVYPGETTILRSIRWPWMTVSLDRAIVRAGAPTWGVLEAKWRQWADWSDGQPLVVQTQIAHGCIVTGWNWGVGVGVIRGKYAQHHYELDENFARQHIARCAEMWQRIQNGDAPPADGHAATTRALKALYPGDSGETIDLDDSDGTNGKFANYTGMVANREAFKNQIKEAEAMLQGIDNNLRAAIGSATWGQLPDGRRIQYKTEPRAAYAVAASTPRVLRILKAPKGK